jgi:VanZ family protein
MRHLLFSVFIILILCVVPVPKSLELFEGIDKAEHLVFYWFFTAYVITQAKNIKSSAIAWAFLVLAVVVEFVQYYFTDYRSFEIEDIIFGWIGVTLGHASVVLFNIYRKEVSV